MQNRLKLKVKYVNLSRIQPINFFPYKILVFMDFKSGRLKNFKNMIMM